MESLDRHPLGSPGSNKAVENGCTCPVHDNSNGEGFGMDTDGVKLFYVRGECPVHDNGKSSMPVWWGA